MTTSAFNLSTLTMRCASFAAIAGCLLLLAVPPQIEAKVFTHCEFAQELRRLQIPESQIATWVCIAHYESMLNSSATSGTGDHGIFQISEEYWCSSPGRGKGCSLTCAELEDDDITDDVECVQTIFDEHQGLSGNGFSAWAVYPRCKKSSNANRFIKKCTAGSIDNSIDSQSADIPVDLRFGSPSYSSAPRSSYFSKPSYISTQDIRFAKPSANSFSQDYSFQSSYSPSEHFGLGRTSVSPFSQGQDYSRRYDPFSYTTKGLTQVISSSTAPPPPAILAYNPSIYSFSRPSSYSIGSIYYNPFETKSTTPAPVVYSFNPRKSFSSHIFDSSRTLFGFQSTPAPQVFKSTTPAPVVYSFNPRKSFSSPIFDSSRSLFGFQSTPAPKVFKASTQLDGAVIKTSSPAPPLKFSFKPPWADFPWWNGGK